MKVQGPEQLVGQTIINPDGRRVGVIRRVKCADDDRYSAQWSVVSLGPWGTRPPLVPLHDAGQHPSRIELAHPRATVLASPRVAGRLDDLALQQAAAYYRQRRP